MLDRTQLASVMTILEKIDEGRIQPQAPGHVGRFLRQYRLGRARLNSVLAGRRVERRADAAVSGDMLGEIEIHPLMEPEVSLLGFPLGEVAEALSISEELGVVTSMVMWLKNPIPNTAYNLLREHSGLRLSGDYRWTPPARVTPGEAQLEASDAPIRWEDARCLKAVADDLARPPHALEYVLDYRLGPPGLKYFRCVCAANRGRGWEVLPGLSGSRSVQVLDGVPETPPTLEAAGLATLLIYREPWSSAWHIVRGAAVSAEQALAHTVAWADFQNELDERVLDASTIEGIRDSLRASGLSSPASAEPNLTRSLLPAARAILRWLRGFT